MSFLRLEDLFVAILFVVAITIAGWAATDANDASPLVSTSTVVMERGTTVDEVEPVTVRPAAEIQVAAHERVCPCCAGVMAQASTPSTRCVLPPRPVFVN